MSRCHSVTGVVGSRYALHSGRLIPPTFSFPTLYSLLRETFANVSSAALGKTFQLLRQHHVAYVLVVNTWALSGLWS